MYVICYHEGVPLTRRWHSTTVGRSMPHGEALWRWSGVSTPATSGWSSGRTNKSQRITRGLVGAVPEVVRLQHHG